MRKQRVGQHVSQRREPLASGRRLPEWLATAPHARTFMRCGDTIRVPVDGQVHARKMGSTVTACGRGAVYWVNFYDRAYIPGASGSCEDCDAALRGTDK
jgi:hypothetical protein